MKTGKSEAATAATGWRKRRPAQGYTPDWGNDKAFPTKWTLTRIRRANGSKGSPDTKKGSTE